MGIGRVYETIQPKQYYAILETGKIMQVEVSKFNKYACPKHCSIKHFHRVYIYTDKYLNNSELIQMMVKDEEQIIPISIENYKIIDLIENDPEKSKTRKGPGVPIQLGKQFPWLFRGIK